MVKKNNQNLDLKKPSKIKVKLLKKEIEVDKNSISTPNTPEKEDNQTQSFTPTSTPDSLSNCEEGQNLKLTKNTFKDKDSSSLKKNLEPENHQKINEQEILSEDEQCTLYEEQERTMVEEKSPHYDFFESFKPPRLFIIVQPRFIIKEQYKGVVPYSPVPKVIPPKTLPIICIIGLIFLTVINTRSVLQKYFLFKKEKEGEKRKESLCFFVRAHLIRRGIELDDEVVATANVEEINIEFQTNLTQFMKGRIVGVLDERTHYLLIQIYPNKKYYYNAELNRQFDLFSPFIYLKDIKTPFWRKKPSLKKITEIIKEFFLMISI